MVQKIKYLPILSTQNSKTHQKLFFEDLKSMKSTFIFNILEYHGLYKTLYRDSWVSRKKKTVARRSLKELIGNMIARKGGG